MPKIEYRAKTENALPPKQAAEFLGVTPKTLANWRSAGQGPDYIKYGNTIDNRGRKRGAVVYLPSALRAYRDACSVKTGGAS